ncbi:MAG: hypothetical protein WDM79_12960 [Terricaulis sp.]
MAQVLVVDDNEAAIELTRIVLIEGARLTAPWSAPQAARRR